jgi:hypothetical protein
MHLRGAHLHTLHLPLTCMLNHLLPLGRRCVLPAFAQHLPPLGRQLLESAEILPNRGLLIRGQRLESVPSVTKGAALVGRQRVPLLEPLLSLPALFR